jgi:hypothetical protein
MSSKKKKKQEEGVEVIHIVPWKKRQSRWCTRKRIYKMEIFFTTKDFLWKYFIFFFYLKPNPYAWGSGLSLSSSPARICYRWLEKKALRMAQIGAWLRVNLIRKWDPAHRTEAEIVIDPSSSYFLSVLDHFNMAILKINLKK